MTMTGSQAPCLSLVHQDPNFKVCCPTLVWCVFKPKFSAEFRTNVKNPKKNIFTEKSLFLTIGKKKI